MIEREPIPLNPRGAVMSVLAAACQSDPARIALAAYAEGRGLEGQWKLEITAARLVPVEDD